MHLLTAKQARAGKENAYRQTFIYQTRIVEQMKQAQGITEQLKADDTLEWIGRMSNIQACAREIVDKEMIYQ